MARRAIAALAVAIVFASPAVARAADDASQRASSARDRDRPYTLVEVGGGVLSLPAAQVCISSLNDCKQGEASLAVGIRNMYRYHRFEIGAGIEWATTLRQDAAPGDPSLAREHSRRYFLVEGLGRYFLFTSPKWEVWAGPAVGVVIVNDSWSTNADRNPYENAAYVGPRATVIGTQGFTVGSAIGANWAFLPNLSLGAQLRYSMWFLPSDRTVSPTGDQASLSGRLDMLDVGVTLAYRIAL